MKEVFEKIIERFEEEREWSSTHGKDVKFREGRLSGLRTGMRIVKEVAEECKSLPVEQKSLTEKFNDGWIPCSSGEVPKAHNEVWITYKWDDGSIHVGRDRVIHGEWHCTKREAIIAWKYMKNPAPYKPKGEK